MGAGAAHRGEAPGVVNTGDGRDSTLARGRDSRPRGAHALRERLPVEEDDSDRWDRGGSDTELGKGSGRRGALRAGGS